MKGKTVISHCASVTIIYAVHDPSQVFVERKDDTHPDPSARGGVNFIGGNLDEDGQGDISPFDTLSREVHEELWIPEDGTIEDAEVLSRIKAEIIEDAVPFGVFMNSPPAKGTATHKEPALMCVWTSGLNMETWTKLAEFQRRYGDLCVEYSTTSIVSLEDVVSGKVPTAFGNGARLQCFWLGMGYENAWRIPLDKYNNTFVGMPPDSYKNLFQKFNVPVKPT